MQWNQHVVKMTVIKQSKQLYVSLISKHFANVIYGMDNKHLKNLQSHIFCSFKNNLNMRDVEHIDIFMLYFTNLIPASLYITTASPFV